MVSKKEKMIALGIIAGASLLDAFGGSIPVIGTVSNILFETVTLATTGYLAIKK